MNISSIVVQTTPAQKDNVLAVLSGNKKICEVHYHDEKGRIVVTIDGESTEEEIKKLQIIQNIRHVITANLIYSYSEEELDAAKDLLVSQDNTVPELLNDDSIDARDITYFGDLKKKHFPV